MKGCKQLMQALHGTCLYQDLWCQNSQFLTCNYHECKHEVNRWHQPTYQSNITTHIHQPAWNMWQSSVLQVLQSTCTGSTRHLYCYNHTESFAQHQHKSHRNEKKPVSNNIYTQHIKHRQSMSAESFKLNVGKPNHSELEQTENRWNKAKRQSIKLIDGDRYVGSERDTRVGQRDSFKYLTEDSTHIDVSKTCNNRAAQWPVKPSHCHTESNSTVEQSSVYYATTGYIFQSKKLEPQKYD
jgi:hypothetical protein